VPASNLLLGQHFEGLAEEICYWRKLHDLVQVGAVLDKSTFGIVREYLINDIPVMRRMKAQPVKRHKPNKARGFGGISGTPGAARCCDTALNARGAMKSTAA